MVECNLAKVEVASSNLVSRSKILSVLSFLITPIRIIACIVWSIFWISLATFVNTTKKDPTKLLIYMAHKFWAPGLLRMMGIKLHLEVSTKIDWNKSYMFLMNHQSLLDPIITYTVMPNNPCYIVKKSLKYFPIVGGYLRSRKMILIDRKNKNSAIESLRQATDRVAQGMSIICYPEGTRTLNGKIGKFKKGPFVLALDLDLQIVPVAIEGAFQLLPRGTLWIRPGQISYKIGDPISLAGYSQESRDDLLKKTREIIIDLHRSIGGTGGDELLA